MNKSHKKIMLRFVENSITKWTVAMGCCFSLDNSNYTLHITFCDSAISSSVSSDVVNVVASAVASVSSPGKWSSSPVAVESVAALTLVTSDVGWIWGSIGRARIV